MNNQDQRKSTKPGARAQAAAAAAFFAPNCDICNKDKNPTCLGSKLSTAELKLTNNYEQNVCEIYIYFRITIQANSKNICQQTIQSIVTREKLRLNHYKFV